MTVAMSNIVIKKGADIAQRPGVPQQLIVDADFIYVSVNVKFLVQFAFLGLEMSSGYCKEYQVIALISP